ncbi:MAG: bifunctional oligoribonuclease/PAP phosphatase NrnA [Clostridiales bacterium]|nr:bifunctional oligoribonuclease/PAP phosphatase NrnA [Clostridiales bacterium]MCC8106693.1 bifunctional oligoribonuclease/PAP phosphatase NrnA [Clostridiales bacterium]
MINLAQELQGVRTAAMAGHIRPDGDAIGSCLGLYLYLRENYPDIQAKIYLEEVPTAFDSVYGVEEISTDYSEDIEYDVFFCLDCADERRLGPADKYRKTARRTVCIDHHVSNGGFADANYIVPDASSASELVFTVLEEDKIPIHAAEALYMGIAHDTGVFRYSCTSPQTMQIAASLIARGIDFPSILSATFYDKTYYQKQILGRALLESMLLMDGKVIFSAIKAKDMKFYNVTSSDMEGIVENLLQTSGTEAAIFLYETGVNEYKVSLRSKNVLDVSVIASYFGGGGHVRAAGCTMQGSIYDVVNNITLHMEKQFLHKA